MFNVTLTYADQTTFFAGCFVTLDVANAWVAQEQARPYWAQSTQVHIQQLDEQGNPIA